MDAKSFTGRARKRRTSPRVRLADRTARLLISLGGAGTILAVGTVCLFLVWVVVPLFLPARTEYAGTVRLEDGLPGSPPSVLRADERGHLAWAWRADGTLDVLRTDTGRLLSRRRPFGEAVPTAASFAASESRAVFGFADGTARFANLGFATEFLPEEGQPAALKALRPGEFAESDGGLVDRTVEGQLRRQSLRFDPEAPFDLGRGKGILRLDMTFRGSSPKLAACTTDGTFEIVEVTERKNLLTGKVRTDVEVGSLPLPAAAGGAPDYVLLSGTGTTAYAAWRSGRCLRVDVRNATAPAVAETVDLLGDPARTLTSLGFLIGKTTLVAGDSGGRIRAWFPVRPHGAHTGDGAVLVAAHELPGPAAAVTCTGPSERTRLLAAGYADGSVRLFHVTAGRVLVEGRCEGSAPTSCVAVTPKDDGLVAWSAGSLAAWRVDAPHPETTLETIFGKVWYEGSGKPEHVWQSSSGSDDFEPKYGLLPLIFGTLKATLYSMLFAIPIALLGAIYTSEFLRPEVRAKVKPAIELMASLPSVVLGFLAALVIAPFAESRVPALLASFATIPFSLLLGAHLWQILPKGTAARWAGWRLALAGGAVVLGVLLAAVVGGPAERCLFEGDVKGWLDGRIGSGTGGWFLLAFPLCSLGAVVLTGRLSSLLGAGKGARTLEAGFGLLRFLATVAAAAGAAWVLSSVLAGLGFDPRGSFLDTYVQRNSLVVGFVMGFAVIPIVYTLAEDALASVPEHLRAASLAVGATRWQTAVSVILPTAASGLFSACMIGLGRAVGETMIVLMAAGNTPVMEWNVFNGFRTLSANIATELPEAVQNGTNYRMLFLAALCLFAMTFVLNTAAEVVRQRFRKRAFEL